ncbi:unnamed protein product, partial [Ectocarpus sp. 12 AP-2014]
MLRPPRPPKRWSWRRRCFAGGRWTSRRRLKLFCERDRPARQGGVRRAASSVERHCRGKGRRDLCGPKADHGPCGTGKGEFTCLVRYIIGRCGGATNRLQARG